MAKKHHNDHSIYILAVIAIVAVATISLQGQRQALPPVQQMKPLDPIGDVQVEYTPNDELLDDFDRSIPVYEQDPVPPQATVAQGTKVPLGSIGQGYLPNSERNQVPDYSYTSDELSNYGGTTYYGSRFSTSSVKRTREDLYGIQQQTPNHNTNAFSGYGIGTQYGSRFYGDRMDRNSRYVPTKSQTNQVPHISSRN